MTEQLHFHFSLSCIREGNGNPLQCSCLENPRDSGAWWAAIYGVAWSRTRLKRLSSSSSSSSVCLMYWGAPMLGALIFCLAKLIQCFRFKNKIKFKKKDIYNCYVFLLDWFLDHYVVSLLISRNLYFKVYFVWYEDYYSSFLLLPVCMEYIFPSSHFQSICILMSVVGFL